MPLSPDRIHRLASLAHLRLSDDEARLLARELDAILEHLAVLGGVEPGTSPADGEAATPLRDDRVGPEPMHLPLAELAPAWRDGRVAAPSPRAPDAPAGGAADPS